MPEDSDYYDSGPAESSADQKPPDSGKAKTKPGEDKKSEATTALLPKSLFPGEAPAIGDVCQFKVEHVWEDEVEVSYNKEGEGDEKSPRNRSAMDDATEAFDKMATPAPTTE
jgi:hypothetical protein